MYRLSLFISFILVAACAVTNVDNNIEKMFISGTSELSEFITLSDDSTLNLKGITISHWPLKLLVCDDCSIVHKSNIHPQGPEKSVILKDGNGNVKLVFVDVKRKSKLIAGWNLEVKAGSRIKVSYNGSSIVIQEKELGGIGECQIMVPWIKTNKAQQGIADSGSIQFQAAIMCPK